MECGYVAFGWYGETEDSIKRVGRPRLSGPPDWFV